MHLVLERDGHALCRTTNKSQFQKPGRFLRSGKGFVHLSLHYFMWMILQLKSWSGSDIGFLNSRIEHAGKELLFPYYCYIIYYYFIPLILLNYYYCYIILLLYYLYCVLKRGGLCFTRRLFHLNKNFVIKNEIKNFVIKNE